MTSTVTGPLKGTLCQLQDGLLKLLCRNLKPCNAGCTDATCTNVGNTSCTTCSTNCVLLAQGSNPTAEGQCGICNQWCEWTLCGPCGNTSKCISCGGCSGCKTGGRDCKSSSTEPCSNCESCPSTSSSTTQTHCKSDTIVNFSLGSYFCPCGGKTRCGSCNKCNKCSPCACPQDWKCGKCGWLARCITCSRCSRCEPCFCPSKLSWREGYDQKLLVQPDLTKNCSPCANVYDNKSVKKPCEKKNCWDKKDCDLSSCTTCAIRPCPPASKKCVCPDPEFTYDQVITKFPGIAEQLQNLYSELIDQSGAITDFGWSFLILVALKNDSCDCVIKEVLKIIDKCPGHNVTYLAKFDIISRLANVVCLDLDMLYLLTLIVSYMGDATQYPTCGQTVPSNISAAFSTCTKALPPEGCTTSCAQDCNDNIYFFDIACVLPTTYMFAAPQRDITFNLLLISLLYLLEIQRCGTRCFDGFCVKPVAAVGEPSGSCFPFTTVGYVMDSDSYEFYRTVRNTYAKLKQNCDPQAVLSCFNPQYLYYFMMCNWREYERCVEKKMCGDICLPCPPKTITECPDTWWGLSKPKPCSQKLFIN